MLCAKHLAKIRNIQDVDQFKIQLINSEIEVIIYEIDFNPNSCDKR